jgi:hypothetical protein
MKKHRTLLSLALAAAMMTGPAAGLRAESVHRQTEGLLAARSEEQAEADMVDASGIVIADMGSLKAILSRKN